MVTLLAMPALAGKPVLPQLTPKQQQELDSGKLVFVTEKRSEGPSVVTGLAKIRVGHDRLWSLLLDTREIKRASKSVRELETYMDAPGPAGTRVIKLNYLVKSGPIELRYYVKREYIQAERYMTWTLDTEQASDIVATTGSYSTHDTSTDGQVLFLYRASVDVGKNVPAWIEERLAASSLKRYLLHIKEIAETGEVQSR
ncbi:MAG TPA: hypothetical protein DIU15_19485 [Deltaproteobacteria bacterium]|nr:hypothetical protein [Deltaproteobacteria bacterium]